MQGLLTPTNFEFFAKYLLAGFIIMAVRARFVVGERPKVAEQFVEAVILSLVNQLVFLVLFWIGSWVAPLGKVPQQALFFVEVLVVPVLLGWAFGANLEKGWNQAVLRRLSMPIQNPTRRAYDHALMLNSAGGFVILTYADGTKVYGLYGSNSLAATDTARSDIYLERLYDVDDTGRWYEQIPPRSGLLILEGLRSLEFLNPEEAQDGRNDAEGSQ